MKFPLATVATDQKQQQQQQQQQQPDIHSGTSRRIQRRLSDKKRLLVLLQLLALLAVAGSFPQQQLIRMKLTATALTLPRHTTTRPWQQIILQRPTTRSTTVTTSTTTFSAERLSTRLRATNSRELRFYNGGTTKNSNNNNNKNNNENPWLFQQQQQQQQQQQATQQSWVGGPLALWEALTWTATTTPTTASSSSSSSSSEAITTTPANFANFFASDATAKQPQQRTSSSTTSSQTTSTSTLAANTALPMRTTTTTTTVNGFGTTTSTTTTTFFRSFSNGPSNNNNPNNNNNNNNNNNDGQDTNTVPNNNPLNNNNNPPRPVLQGYGSSIVLTPEEEELFQLLRRVRQDTGTETTLRVAGGWVRDKLLATPEFHTYHAIFEVAGKRLTSKFRTSHKQQTNANGRRRPVVGSRSIPASPQASLGRLGTKILTASEDAVKPVDIDIALDDMLGREFAEQLNEYLSSLGEETHSVGVVLKNPEKSKHLETATMKVGSFWIDFVNLRAEEYTQDSRIPDLMRIGTAEEDAMRRDLTINALFYNINTGEVEDWTGRGFEDLRRGIVATPLPPLTTLLDDPLRVLRSVRFAARLRFTIDQDLQTAAKDVRVRTALAQKVSRERVGGEVELMLRSPDPVGAMRLLLQLDLIETVFPSMTRFHGEQGLSLLSTSHDHLADCRWSPPIWCQQISANGGRRLVEDEEGRRLLWYTSFLKPLWDFYQQQEAAEEKLSVRQSKKQKRKNSPVKRLLVDDLKRPSRDAESIEKILKAADEISDLVKGGGVVSGTMILLSDVNVREEADPEAPDQTKLVPYMCGRKVEPTMEDDPVWAHAMDYRLACSQMLQRIGPLWRAALILALSEELNTLQACEDTVDYCIEGDFVDESQEERRRGIIEKYDIFAASLLRLSLIGSWDLKPLLDGGAVKKILPRIPKGPAFRTVMEEQSEWMAKHPGASAEDAKLHLQLTFPDFAAEEV